MGVTINPPVQKTCGDSSTGHILNSNTTSVIVRNRSGTEIANVNYGTSIGSTQPSQGGNNAVRLLPDDSIQLVGDGVGTPKIYYVNDVDGESPQIEIIEFT